MALGGSPVAGVELRSECAMKRNVPAWSGFAMALLVPMWLLSVPAAAQSHGSSGGSSSSGGGATSSGGGGGGGGSSSTGTSHASGGGGSSSGTAVSRDSGGSTGGVYLPPGYYGGYYPYGYGGLGFGSYYGYSDPWYDPFYGGFGGYGYGGYGYGGSYGGSQYSTSSGEEGSLRLKIKPRDASVL